MFWKQIFVVSCKILMINFIGIYINWIEENLDIKYSTELGLQGMLRLMVRCTCAVQQLSLSVYFIKMRYSSPYSWDQRNDRALAKSWKNSQANMKKRTLLRTVPTFCPTIFNDSKGNSRKTARWWIQVSNAFAVFILEQLARSFLELFELQFSRNLGFWFWLLPKLIASK